MTPPSIGDYWDRIKRLRQALEEADAVLVGAGAGLSASAGLTYDGPRFAARFGDFIRAYHFHDMYTAGFYPYVTREEYWAYWSRHIYYNRYDQPVGEPYRLLLQLLAGKDYFVLTTNVDHCFQLAGFDKARLFYTQGDYGLWQCSVPCHDRTYDNEETVRRMVAEQKNRRVPSHLLPVCPVCGKPMGMNLRCDDTFVQDAGWYQAQARYGEFLRRRQGARLLFWELGVGSNTPGIIKYPFWKMTWENPRAAYACLNRGEAFAPRELQGRAICLDRDIGQALADLAN